MVIWPVVTTLEITEPDKDPKNPEETIATFAGPPRVLPSSAVANDMNVTGFVGNWLLPASDVNDAQPPHPHRQLAIDQPSIIVGTAVQDRRQHTIQHICGCQPRWVEIQDACDATHNDRSRCQEVMEVTGKSIECVSSVGDFRGNGIARPIARS